MPVVGALEVLENAPPRVGKFLLLRWKVKDCDFECAIKIWLRAPHSKFTLSTSCPLSLFLSFFRSWKPPISAYFEGRKGQKKLFKLFGRGELVFSLVLNLFKTKSIRSWIRNVRTYFPTVPLDLIQNTFSVQLSYLFSKFGSSIFVKACKTTWCKRSRTKPGVESVSCMFPIARIVEKLDQFFRTARSRQYHGPTMFWRVLSLYHLF